MIKCGDQGETAASWDSVYATGLGFLAVSFYSKRGGPVPLKSVLRIKNSW